MRDPLFGRVPEQGPDWFLVATEACGGGTPDLGLFLEVYLFIGIFGVGFTSGRSPGCSRDRGPRPGGALSWAARDSSGPTLLLRGLLLVHKNPQKLAGQLESVWYSFSIKLKYKEKQKLALGSRLIG